MRSVYVQSKSLVGRGFVRTREYGVVEHMVSGRFGRHGQQRWGTRSRPCAPGTQHACIHKHFPSLRIALDNSTPSCHSFRYCWTA